MTGALKFRTLGGVADYLELVGATSATVRKVDGLWEITAWQAS